MRRLPPSRTARPWCEVDKAKTDSQGIERITTVSNDSSLADRVTKLEELVSHQEHQFQQLNESVLKLVADHDRMKAALKQRIDQLESQLAGGSSEFDPDEKPPHY